MENVPVNDADPQPADEPDSEAQDLVTIYAARTATDAHQLKNLLVEAGIPATVTNAVLEVAPLVEVDGRPIGGGRPGPCTEKILSWYRGRAMQASV